LDEAEMMHYANTPTEDLFNRSYNVDLRIKRAVDRMASSLTTHSMTAFARHYQGTIFPTPHRSD
jgi:hypothetical protein